MVELLSHYTVQVVAVGAGLLGAISGGLGCFAVLRKESLLGDGISHAALPGVVLGFLVLGSKNTAVMLLGALVFGLLATGVIGWIVTYTRLQFDAALALVLAVFFGFGMVLLTYTQSMPNANQAGLDSFIYGQATGMLYEDVVLIAVCGAVLLVVLLAFWKEFKLLSFDPQSAQVMGLPTKQLDGLLRLMMVVAIVLGLQTVGVILMSAMLIAPAVAARQWVTGLGAMVLLASFLGAVSAIAGTLVSAMGAGLATGPTIVVCGSVLAMGSLLVAPERGVVAKMIQRAQSIHQTKGEGRL